MSDTIHSLPLDALVRKHVRLSPAVRYHQMVCLLLGTIPLLLIFAGALAIAGELAAFVWLGLSQEVNLWVLDFHITFEAIQHMLIAKEGLNLGSLASGGFFEIVRRCMVLVAFLYATLSFISLRFNMLAYVAMLFFWAQFLIDRLSVINVIDVTSPSTAVRWVSAIWMTGLSLYLLYLVIKALIIQRAMPQPEKDVVREGRARRFHISNFLLAFGIPMNIKNSSRQIRTTIYSYLGNLAAFVPILFLLLAGGLLYLLALILFAIGVALWEGRYDVTLLTYLFALVVFGPLLYLLVIGFRIVGNRFLRASRRFLRVSLEQAQATDPRRPVLFLRSFRDDAVILPPPPKPGLAYRLFNYAERNTTLDELLLEEGTSLGPVVALGNPTDPVPPYGAARVYFHLHNNDWQKMIADLMEQAVAIVICVDNSEGLWWEIKHVAEQEHLGKTLFLLHPKYDLEDRVPDIAPELEKLLGTSAISQINASGQKFMGLWFDRMSQAQVGLASRFSRTHYLLMLRWFLRSRGDETEAQRSL
jgi:hypothetical protein